MRTPGTPLPVTLPIRCEHCARSTPSHVGAPPDLVPRLVARVFEEAPLALRGRLLEHLLKPLGLLSLVAVANGIFAKLVLREDWPRSQVLADDTLRVDAGDVMALVHHVQQVSVYAIDSLGTLIATSPVLAGSATASLLLAVLSKQARSRTPHVSNDFDPGL